MNSNRFDADDGRGPQARQHTVIDCRVDAEVM
jgi:hypothetical protein